jgi:hypothetical protein
MLFALGHRKKDSSLYALTGLVGARRCHVVQFKLFICLFSTYISRPTFK